MRSKAFAGLTLSLALLAVALTGCGSSPGNPASPKLTGSTALTVLLSSTANDKISQFNLQLLSLTLTNQSGKQVVLTAPAPTLYPEFIHLNGISEELFTTSIPQDIYVSAAASVGGAQFTCVDLDSGGGVEASTFAYGATPASQVAVSLPAPITVTGSAMGVAMNLMVSPSAAYQTCNPVGIAQFSINPTFNLTPVNFSTAATDGISLAEPSLSGLTSSIVAADGSLAVTSSDGIAWTIQTSNATVLQGVSNASAIAANIPIDMDLAIQPTGELLATRIAVRDTNSGKVSASGGPMVNIAASQPTGVYLGRQNQGFLYENGGPIDSQSFSFGSAIFSTSSSLTNLASLPFTAVFSAATMVPGQNIEYTTHATMLEGGPIYVPASTVTLVPQTIDGVIQSISSSGAFEVYTVTLAPYALTSALAVQIGQANLLTHPGTVVVYVDENAHELNSAAPAVGGTLRLTGLLFNDGGTLRMDCSQINDGVAQ